MKCYLICRMISGTEEYVVSHNYIDSTTTDLSKAGISGDIEIAKWQLSWVNKTTKTPDNQYYIREIELNLGKKLDFKTDPNEIPRTFFLT